MIRSIICVILVAIFLIATLPIYLVQSVIRRSRPHYGEKFGFKMIQFGLRFISLPLGIKVEVKGRENIPSEGACLFIGNHRSYMDVILGYPLLPRLTGFVAKADFLKAPIFPLWMKRLRCEFLVNKDLKQNLQCILNAIEHVKDGIPMFIYPEGMRSKQEDETELLEFHEGSFKIATRTKCPIIPVACVGTRERFEATFPRVTPGRVIFEFGKPIDVASMSREELKGIGAKTRLVLEEMVKRNHEELTGGKHSHS